MCETTRLIERAHVFLLVISFLEINGVTGEKGAVEHLCVFQDERNECIHVPENTEKLAENGTCKLVNPGKKGTEIIECFKEWVESDLVEE